MAEHGLDSSPDEPQQPLMCDEAAAAAAEMVSGARSLDASDLLEEYCDAPEGALTAPHDTADGDAELTLDDLTPTQPPGGPEPAACTAAAAAATAAVEATREPTPAEAPPATDSAKPSASRLLSWPDLTVFSRRSDVDEPGMPVSRSFRQRSSHSFSETLDVPLRQISLVRDKGIDCLELPKGKLLRPEDVVVLR